MDRLDALATFVAVAERRSFAAAARDRQISASAATRAVAEIEARLGVTLLNRSTRAVSLTDEGATFLDRARRIIGDLRDAEHMAMGGQSTPQGQLHVTAPVMFGRLHVLPALSDLLRQHSQLSARMMLIDRNVRIVEEGIDVAVRIGALADSALRSVPLGTVRQVIVAAPAYLKERGRPEDIETLASHDVIVGAGPRTISEWRFRSGRIAPASPRLSVNTVDAAIAAAEGGLGLANLLSYQVADSLKVGKLVEILSELQPDPIPVSLLFDGARARSPGVRAFIEAMRERARSGWD